MTPSPQDIQNTQDSQPLDPAQDLLADYLAGEMSQEQARAFEARMESDPLLARQAVAFRQTLKAIDAGFAPTQPVQSGRHAPGPLGHIGWAIARYAAVAAVAYIVGAGFLSSPRPVEPDLSARLPITHSQDPAPEKLAELKVDSGLAQGLLRITQ